MTSLEGFISVRICGATGWVVMTSTAGPSEPGITFIERTRAVDAVMGVVCALTIPTARIGDRKTAVR